MPETTAAPARVCLLDDGYSREARSLLYNAYRHEPTFAYIFEAQRPGYERRLRVMVREWVRQHFYLQLPAIGLLVEDRLIALALIVPPQRSAGRGRQLGLAPAHDAGYRPALYAALHGLPGCIGQLSAH